MKINTNQSQHDIPKITERELELENALHKCYDFIKKRGGDVSFIDVLFGTDSDGGCESAAYNSYSFERILHSNFNKLKARVLNLFDISARDDQQRIALMKLTKDFFRDSYGCTHSEVTHYLEHFGVLDPDTHSTHSNVPKLEQSYPAE